MSAQFSELAIVVPTYNMAEHLAALVVTLETSGLASLCSEAVFVDDGSTDDTEPKLKSLLAENAELGAKSRVIKLDRNYGRFKARFRGAEATRAERILFVDSRVQFAPDFGSQFTDAARKFRNIIPNVEINEHQSVFCLYWKRSHEFIFRNHFRALSAPIELTPANFDKFLKGTTVLLCTREVFLSACRRLSGDEVLNDDYRVLEEFVKIEPLTIVPELKIIWVPREDWLGFLQRLWNRGPSFIEYHFVLHRGGFFWVVIFGLASLMGWGLLAWVSPSYAAWIALSSLIMAVLSTALFTRRPSEFFRMLGLHLCVLVVFGSGILFGIGVNLARPKMRRSLWRNLLGRSLK